MPQDFAELVPEPDYADPKEVFAFTGLALHAAQVLEVELTNIAVALRRAAQQGAMSASEVDAWFSDYEAKTFGGIAAAIRKIQPLPAATETLVGRALQARNRLTHHFFREHDQDIMSESGRRVMVDELRDVIVLFKQADAAGTAISQPLWAQFGVTPQLVDQELALIAAEAALRDAAV